MIEMLQSFFAFQFSFLFVAVTSLGDGTVLAGLSAAIYWCFDKSGGRVITYVLFFGAYLNFFLKILIAWPRPPIEFRIAEKSETSYGFPSGHAQDSRILGILGVAIVVAVGISRVWATLSFSGNWRMDRWPRGGVFRNVLFAAPSQTKREDESDTSGLIRFLHIDSDDDCGCIGPPWAIHIRCR